MARCKYRPDRLSTIKGWARDGLINKEIAARLGISEATLYDWKNKYPEFSEALKEGKEDADYRVENSLFSRAVGYEYEEVEETFNIRGELVRRKICKKTVLPDVTAQIFWLKNRRPESWKDRQELAHSGSVDICVDIVEGEDESKHQDQIQSV